ncbi:hypothetical protein AB4Z35_00755 [Pseudomonas sp. KB_15]|uniref:hypothetical protein n=1 Tax=Pseudomonas sp. KB_15 TaxID=3233035 RepID=UPI003F983794
MSGEKRVFATLLFCRSWLASDGGLPADLILSDAHHPCGSGLAREGGLTANQSITDVPDPIVGASLLAMAAYQSAEFIAQANHSDHSHKTFRLPVGSTITSL